MEKQRQPPKPVFKEYNHNQMWLLPQSLDEMIPQNHVVRTINQTIDALNIDEMRNRYKRNGCSSYQQKMMLKVLIYAYTQKVFTSQLITKVLRENIHFIWIAGKKRHSQIRKNAAAKTNMSRRCVCTNVKTVDGVGAAQYVIRQSTTGGLKSIRLLRCTRRR